MTHSRGNPFVDMWTKVRGIKKPVDNPQKLRKTGENTLAIAIWICYNYEAVLAEQNIWLKKPYLFINVT